MSRRQPAAPQHVLHHEFCSGCWARCVMHVAGAGADAWYLAGWLLENCRSRQVETDGVTMTAAISAVSDQWVLGLRFLSRLSQSLQPNAVSLNASLAALGSEWRKALRLSEAAESHGLDVDAAGYDTLLAVCNQSGGWKEVLLLASKMTQADVQLGHLSCEATLKAFARAGLWLKVLGLLTEMPRLALRPSADAVQAGYAAVAHADRADPTVASGTVRRLHCGELRFTQSSISSRFHSGELLSAKIQQLASGTVQVSDEWFQLRAVRYGEHLLCMNNRRLYCFNRLKELLGEAWDGMLEVEVFEWPRFDTASRAVFEEFAQQLNNAVGYRFGEVTLRGLSADTPNVGL
eukprot:s748_g10.t1